MLKMILKHTTQWRHFPGDRLFSVFVFFAFIIQFQITLIFNNVLGSKSFDVL